MMANRADMDVVLDACLRGSRGNLTAAWLAGSEVDDPVVSSSVCRRVERMAKKCPAVDDDGGRGSFVWLDGSRRARLAVV